MQKSKCVRPVQYSKTDNRQPTTDNQQPTTIQLSFHFQLSTISAICTLMTPEWKPIESTLLEFDLNSCTVRDFCEVFDLEPSIAGGLYEYRTEMLHIFKFDQLLKLKGTSDKVIQKWREPNPSFSSEFQKTLGLQTTREEPFSTILEALCHKTDASIALASPKNGGKLLHLVPSPKGNHVLFDQLAPQISAQIFSVRENLFELNLPGTELQLIRFEAYDLIFIPAGGLAIVAILPKGTFNQSSIALWRSFSEEIRKRYPPKLLIENHATVTETDIAFDCPQCQLRIVVAQEAAGADFQCPRCHAAVTVPSETTSFSSFVQTESKQESTKSV